MPQTYESIATATTSGSATTVSFTSISGTFTDIVIVANYAQAANGGVAVRVNNDSTSTLYSSTRLRGDGSGAASSRRTAQNQWYMPEGNTVPTAINANSIFHFMNYSNTTTNKTILQRDNAAASGVSAVVGLWRNTNAIDRIDFICLSSDTFVNGSTFTLYGIKAA